MKYYLFLKQSCTLKSSGMRRYSAVSKPAAALKYLKYSLILFLVAWGLGLVSCSPSRKLKPSDQAPAFQPVSPSLIPYLPDSLPRLPVSEVDLPLKICARPLLAMADSIVPKEFLSDKWPDYMQPSCDFRYKYRFVRSGFIMTCINNRIGLQMTGNYQVAGSRCLCALNKPVSPWVSGSCGFGKEPMRRVDISISSRLNFLPSYRIQTISRLESLKAEDRCIVSMLSTDMTQQILDSIHSSVSSFCSALDATVAGMDFSGYIRQKAARAWERNAIGPYGYLIINPVAIRAGQLNYTGDTLTISVGFSCQPEFSSESGVRSDGSSKSSAAGSSQPANGAGQPSANSTKPAPSTAVTKPVVYPLPSFNAGNNRDGVSLYLNAVYDYPFLNKLLNDSLRNKVFVVKGRTVIIKEVEMKGIGHHQVEMRIDFAGDHQGQIFLRGTPVLDTAKQALSIPDISYSLESQDLALKIARSLMRNKIRKSLQGNSYLDIAALIKTNTPLMDAQLNKKLAPMVFSTGKTREIKMLGLLANEKGLQVQIHIKATLSITCAGLPM